MRPLVRVGQRVTRYAKEVRNDQTFHVDHDEMKVFYWNLQASWCTIILDTNVDITCNIATNAMSKLDFNLSRNTFIVATTVILML